MRKLLIMLLIFISCFMVGCGDSKEEKLAKYEEVMEDYSTDYFDNYVSGVAGLNVLEVSISMLENANSVGGSNYDLAALKECDKTSKTLLYLTDDGVAIAKYEHNLDCDNK